MSELSELARAHWVKLQALKEWRAAIDATIRADSQAQECGRAYVRACADVEKLQPVALTYEI